MNVKYQVQCVSQSGSLIVVGNKVACNGRKSIIGFENWPKLQSWFSCFLAISKLLNYSETLLAGLP